MNFFFVTMISIFCRPYFFGFKDSSLFGYGLKFMELDLLDHSWQYGGNNVF